MSGRTTGINVVLESTLANASAAAAVSGLVVDFIHALVRRAQWRLNRFREA